MWKMELVDISEAVGFLDTGTRLIPVELERKLLN